MYDRKSETIEELTAAIINGVQSIDNELCQGVPVGTFKAAEMFKQ